MDTKMIGELGDVKITDGVNDSSITADTDDIIAAAERRINNLQKVISLALKITNQHDWVDFSGRPFLNASGTQKVARLFGVCWKDLRTDKVVSSDEKGQFYFYKTTGLFNLKGKNDYVEATGTCSSKDKFFGSIGGVEKPLSEIDETNILKASITNCISNGITSLLGLKNLTWEQVTGGAEFKKQNISGFKFASGGKGGGLISDAQCKRLFAILKHAGGSPEILKSYLVEKYKIEASAAIPKNVYEEICEWAGNTENFITDDEKIDDVQFGQ